MLLAIAARAQVLAPEEIRAPQLRALQQKYRTELRMIPAAAKAHEFPYHFYFSRKLDLEEKDQKGADQRSIQFDRYKGEVVLKITGNYFVSYSAELLKPEERARQTYQAVMLPLLEAAARAFENADMPQSFALEISHHVRRKVLGVSSESVENVVLILPKAAAERLVASADPEAREAAVMEGQAFLNAAPISFWPRPEEELAQEKPESEEPAKPARAATPAAVPSAPPEPTVSAHLMSNLNLSNAAAKPEAPRVEETAAGRDTSPDAVKDLQKSYQPNLDRLVQEMQSQAHFVGYAPPAFIPFRAGLYLQLSINTELPQAAAGSQYRLAALAFDQHVSHLVRPVLAYFKDRDDFDGIDFSTTVRLSGATEGGSAVAIEFIFPLKLLRAYSGFDTTGQQLIDAGYVLINGERVSLALQAAEAAPAAQ